MNGGQLDFSCTSLQADHVYPAGLSTRNLKVNYFYNICVYVISYTASMHANSDQIREVKDMVMHHKVCL